MFWNSYSIGLDRLQNCVIQITSNLVATKYTLIQYLYFPLLLSFIWKVSASMLDDMLPNETICVVYLELETMTSFYKLQVIRVLEFSTKTYASD